jgi:transposase
MPRSAKKSLDTAPPIPEPSKTPPKPVGRPSKFTDDVKQKLIKALKLGATHDIAASYAGVSRSLFYEWKAKGEAGDPEFTEILDAIRLAEAIGAIGWLEKIEAAANDGNWQAAAWKLERRYPRDYGKTVQEHSGLDGGAINIKLVRETGFNPTPTISESDE